MFRITWRELAAIATLEQTLSDLTTLAELCLEAALEHHREALEERFGTPRNANGEPQRLVVLGLGKLGGGELNLSSDIDLILAYPEAGECDGRRGLANEQFFTRLARAMIRSLSELTEDGFCFRVDTRLRPFGEAGPLVGSFGALEQYYQREGRDWERYALLKARTVAGDLDAGTELLRSLSPFVYRRYIDYGAVEALREMLDAIREDAARKDRGEDVKRGPGGIREVEFLVQCVQLLRGGREPSLQTPSLHAALQAIEALALFPGARVDELRWTAVRPGWIMDAPPSEHPVISDEVIREDLIRSRTGDIANVLLDAVENDQWVREKPAVASLEPDEATSIEAVAEEVI